MDSFSKKTNWARRLTPLASARLACERAGDRIIDLTCANPTLQGFIYPADVQTGFFCNFQVYEPSALGCWEAREAVAGDFCRKGGHIDAGQIWIGCGTSELYAHTMAILCDPGDCWLVPQPGYPLFDYVADLAEVKISHYFLSWDGEWYLDADVLERAAVSSGARALVVISPHNPTGHMWTDKERQVVIDCCRRHKMALVVDEVFLDYPLASDAVTSCAGIEDVLTICLSGASKVAAFPQGKIAWAAVSGPGAEEFLARAELVSDTFLSTSTVMQTGLAKLLHAAEEMQQGIRLRCQENFKTARSFVAGSSISACSVQAGWSLLLRFPMTCDDATWSMRALKDYGVVTHPGYLFGIESVHDSPFMAVSLLLEADAFLEGMTRLVALAGTSREHLHEELTA